MNATTSDAYAEVFTEAGIHCAEHDALSVGIRRLAVRLDREGHSDALDGMLAVAGQIRESRQPVRQAWAGHDRELAKLDPGDTPPPPPPPPPPPAEASGPGGKGDGGGTGYPPPPPPGGGS